MTAPQCKEKRLGSSAGKQKKKRWPTPRPCPAFGSRSAETKDRRGGEGRAFAILPRSGPVGRSDRHWRQRASLAARAPSGPFVRIGAAEASRRRSRASRDPRPKARGRRRSTGAVL